ncbi:MAG: cob(I)yrinic acid a,c-diamide adenosyltransferase [Propionibacteriaceae bacterium]|jgi:cob(I)alamin adenosyltransferase|nr:cob(I)yrinic acid a,c-diamide adenosyltransferase [Propionibacteriaceae bacterium]
MVNLTRIYTRTGDSGTTRLADNQAVPKTDERVEAYGTADEANCAIGWALTLVSPDDDPRLTDTLWAIQNDLFDVGADLASPAGTTDALRVEPAWVTRLERWCDEFLADQPALRSFILPGGTPLAAALGTARTVVRRAERAAWRAAELDDINPVAIRYLNRLSDLLFILGRRANLRAGHPERLWVPASGEAR